MRLTLGVKFGHDPLPKVGKATLLYEEIKYNVTQIKNPAIFYHTSVRSLWSKLP